VPLHAPISLENGTDPRVTPETALSLASLSPEVMDAIQAVFDLAIK
jgi:hypothetical protein